MNGEVSYTVEVQDVVNVKVKHTGFLRYANGVSWSALESFDSHWAAYKFDRSMDEVLSAYFEFTEVKYAKKIIDKEEKIIEENPEPTKVHITSDQVGTNEQDLKWLGKKHEWQRISRTEEFMSAHGAAFDSDTRTALEDTDWVFQFYETPYTNTQTGGGLLLGGLISHWVTLIGLLVGECTGTHLTGQTLLQLTFKKAGVTYTLGVVDDKRNEPWSPSNPFTASDIPVWVYFVAIVVVILVVLIVLSIVCPQVLPPLFHGVGVVVSAPFKLIGAAVQSAKKASEARKERKEELEAEKDREEARKERRERRKQREAERAERERETDHEKT